MRMRSFLLCLTLLIGASAFAIPSQTKQSITEQTGVYDVGLGHYAVDATFINADFVAVEFNHFETIMPVSTSYKALRFKGHNAKHNRKLLQKYGKYANKNFTIATTEPVNKTIRKKDVNGQVWQEIVTNWIELSS